MKGFSARNIRRLAAKERAKMWASTENNESYAEEERKKQKLCEPDRDGIPREIIIQNYEDQTTLIFKEEEQIEGMPMSTYNSASELQQQQQHQQNDELVLPDTEYDFLASENVSTNTNNNKGIKEFEGIGDEIKSIKQELFSIQYEQVTIKAKLEKVLDNQAKILAILTQSTKKNVLHSQAIFPIETEEKLALADQLAEEDLDKMSAILRGILTPGGLLKNLYRVFSSDLIFTLNYDGLSGKKALKNYTSLNNAMFSAVQTEGYSQTDYVKELREAIKGFKNRIYKKRYDDNKKSNTMNKTTTEN